MEAVISRDPQKVTKRILDAAEREFVAHGYEAASTNRIVLSFGGSKSTLFRHFATKEILLEAVIRRISAEWSVDVRLDELQSTEPHQWLVDFAVMVLEWILKDGPLFVGRLGIAEGHKFPRLTPIFREVAGAPLEEALATRLQVWTESNKLVSSDVFKDASLFFDLVVSGAVSRALYGVERLTGQPLNMHADSATQLFLLGRLPRRI